MHPVLFAFGGFDILVTPVFTGLSALAAFLYMRQERARAGLSLDELWRLVLWLTLSAFAGAILCDFFLFGGGYARNLRWMARHGRVHGGVFYGAFWAAVATAFLYCRLRRLSFRRVADLLGPASLLGLVFKRWGCLLNGCCYGRPGDVPWAVVFTDPRSKVKDAWLGTPLHPLQLYESAAALTLFLLVHFGARKRLHPGAAFTASVASYAALRFALEAFRGSDPGILNALGLNTSQWLALASFTAAALLHRRWAGRVE